MFICSIFPHTEKISFLTNMTETGMDIINSYINVAKDTGFYPDIKTIQGISSTPEVIVDGRKVLLFCSANYLGLANDSKIKRAVIEGIEKYGVHPTGARLISGTLDIHKQLEREIAKFKHGQDAITFSTGSLANIGTIPAVVNIPKISAQSVFSQTIQKEEGFIFSDELNHASIIDGIRLAGVNKYIYKHADMQDLENKLRTCKKGQKLIITDGVFSMDGDIAPLPEIVHLAKKYEAMLMVDDAHATGVLGENGGGTSDFYNINDGIDLNMGTFSKSFGTLGGFIVGSKPMIEYLRFSARTFIFSGALPGSLAAGTLKALEIILHDKSRRKRLLANADYLRSSLNKKGFNTMKSQTPIIPILVGDENIAIDMARKLFSKGILAPCIRWPAVPRGQSRIRLSVIATHTQEHIDYLISTLTKLGEENNLIK